MTPIPRVMLLIDADNVSADVIEQAVHKVLAEHGALHVRRAYCTAEAALKHQALFKRLSVRPMVNLAAGKNSTDIALAVDALDLVIAERPQVVYLVSSDSDFAPLVIRLREKGCRVCGIGQQGKTGDETVGVYDAFTDLAHNGGRQAAAAAPKPAAPARKTRAKPAAESAAKTAADKPAPPAKKTAGRSASRKSAAAPPPAPPSEAAEFILQAVPALRTGKEVALNDAAQALRAAGLLGKHGSSLKLFDKLTDEFAVMQQPDRIRWTGMSAP
ncbi:MAG: NYN domain-containing protein [Variovorax sp.]|nr:MAG: NYN domain-containing protein [Variovorax sp.]